MNVMLIPANITAVNNKNNLKRTCAYCRVSTDLESQESSIKNQKEYFYNMINEDKTLSYVGTYIDQGKSGTNTYSRDNFNQMINDCKAGKIDQIIVKSISRFARNTLDSLKYVKELKKLNVNVYFTKENINSMDEKSEFIFTVLSSLAEEESKSISTNLKWSFKKKFEKGEPMFPYTKFLGFNVINKKVVVVLKEALIIKEIFYRYINGQSMAEIAKSMMLMGYLTGNNKKIWSVNYIKSILSNEKYMGDLLQGKTYKNNLYEKRRHLNNGIYDRYYIKDNHIPIISKEIWYAVQYENESRKQIKYNRITSEKEKICWSGKLKDNQGNNLHRNKITIDHNKLIIWKYGKLSIQEEKLKSLIVKAYNMVKKQKQNFIKVDVNLMDKDKKKLNHGKNTLENYINNLMNKRKHIKYYDDDFFVIVIKEMIITEKKLHITFRNNQEVIYDYK